MQKSRVEIMLTVFFDAKGIIHHEFVLENQALNCTFFKDL
jgi:hypothetical protein